MSENSNLIEGYRLHAKDTGSTLVQLINLEGKIRAIVSHLRTMPRDVPAKRWMLKKNAEKKRLFKYLAKRNPQLAKELEISLRAK